MIHCSSVKQSNLKVANIKLICTGRKPPIVCFKSNYFKAGQAKFHIDTGADISIIKNGLLTESINLDRNNVLKITGVTAGVSTTLGRTDVLLYNSLCEMHVVPDDFPIETYGLIGWDLLTKYGLRINTVDKSLVFLNITCPFEQEESLVIPSHTRPVICAHNLMSGSDANRVHLINLAPGKNNNRMGYAECISNIIAHTYNIDEDDALKNRNNLNPRSIKQLFTETAQNVLNNDNNYSKGSHRNKIERAKKIFSLVAQKSCRKKEIHHIKDLILINRKLKNKEKSQQKLYVLTDKQENEGSRVELDTPPAQIFPRMRSGREQK